MQPCDYPDLVTSVSQELPHQSTATTSGMFTSTDLHPFEYLDYQPLNDSFTMSLVSTNAVKEAQDYHHGCDGCLSHSGGDLREGVGREYSDGGGFKPLDLSGGVRFGRRNFKSVLEHTPVQQLDSQSHRRVPPSEVGRAL